MNKYITDSKLNMSMDRVKDDEIYLTIDKLRSEWTVTQTNGSRCGNVRANFTKTGKCKLKDFPSDRMIPDYAQISSALMLYRTISLFECGVNPAMVDFYKCNWEIELTHNKTKEKIWLGEWKGGFNCRFDARSLDDLSPDFIKAAEHLLTFLVSPHMPINYDGTIAGTVA